MNKIFFNRYSCSSNRWSSIIRIIKIKVFHFLSHSDSAELTLGLLRERFANVLGVLESLFRNPGRTRGWDRQWSLLVRHGGIKRRIQLKFNL